MTRDDTDPRLQPRRMRQDLDRLAKQADQNDGADLIVDGGRQLKVQSPNGTFWGIVVSDAGAISAVNLGTSL